MANGETMTDAPPFATVLTDAYLSALEAARDHGVTLTPDDAPSVDAPSVDAPSPVVPSGTQSSSAAMTDVSASTVGKHGSPQADAMVSRSEGARKWYRICRACSTARRGAPSRHPVSAAQTMRSRSRPNTCKKDRANSAYMTCATKRAWCVGGGRPRAVTPVDFAAITARACGCWRRPMRSG